MAKVINSWTLEQFKTIKNISKLEIFTSKNTGKKYACNKATGEFVGMLSPDFNPQKDISVLEMSDETTGEHWLFICNGEPREADFEL